MRNPTQFIVLLINFLLINSVLQAQDTSRPSTDTTTDCILQLYKNKFYNELNYIDGREYKPYHYPTNENPYLHSTTGIGTLYINGNEYPKKKVLYDIFKDKLIVNPDFYKFSNTYIELNKNEVDSFKIQFDYRSYMFINFKKDKQNMGLTPGFYEQIYNSENSALLIKHFVKRGVNDALPTYSYTTERYLFYGNYYYNITNKKKLLALFPQHKKQLKKKIKSINHSYKKMSPHQLSHLLRFIDTL
ncbi:hypothetical protein J1N10_11710 [Carboxylicivirga sp. A043]|uniref:hypothetical protein n=1 Tax=Carboxylicivirga litoralis TaxID=2816963 RepID=UPI0021CB4946|nr:hypothetical protein [Carboxylicivirga sp. A043]MCU4156644.1 hypothetical protein [Carboxylicivirga sp. A043]